MSSPQKKAACSFDIHRDESAFATHNVRWEWSARSCPQTRSHWHV